MNKPRPYYGEAERKQLIIDMGTSAGWTHDPSKNNQGIMIHFWRPAANEEAPKEIIEVWHHNMTVVTQVNHPRDGRTQKTRKQVSMSTMSAIFENPRVHTAYGIVTDPQPIEKTAVSNESPEGLRDSDLAIIGAVVAILGRVYGKEERDNEDICTCTNLLNTIKGR